MCTYVCEKNVLKSSSLHVTCMEWWYCESWLNKLLILYFILNLHMKVFNIYSKLPNILSMKIIYLWKISIIFFIRIICIPIVFHSISNIHTRVCSCLNSFSSVTKYEIKYKFMHHYNSVFRFSIFCLSLYYFIGNLMNRWLASFLLIDFLTAMTQYHL